MSTEKAKCPKVPERMGSGHIPSMAGPCVYCRTPNDSPAKCSRCGAATVALPGWEDVATCPPCTRKQLDEDDAEGEEREP